MDTLPIVTAVRTVFGKRTVSLVGYGSYFFDRSHSGSDIDLCLLLDSRHVDDFISLNAIIREQSENIDVTVHYLDEVEERGWDNFHHGTHGVFFLNHLGCAELLLGDDIFARKSSLIPKERYITSLICQINQYIDRVQVALTQDSEVDEYFYRKYLTRIMVDMMLLGSEISFREVNRSSTLELTNSYIRNASIFSKSTKENHEKVISEKATPEAISISLSFIVSDFQHELARLG